MIVSQSFIQDRIQLGYQLGRQLLYLGCLHESINCFITSKRSNRMQVNLQELYCTERPAILPSRYSNIYLRALRRRISSRLTTMYYPKRLTKNYANHPSTQRPTRPPRRA